METRLTRFNSLVTGLLSWTEWGWYLSEDNRSYQLRRGPWTDSQQLWAQIHRKNGRYQIEDGQGNRLVASEDFEIARHWVEEQTYYGL